MNLNRQFISDLYHFIAENVIISIIMLLPIHFYYNWIPAWSILTFTIPLCVIFTTLEKREIAYPYFYLIVLILIPGFLLFGYSLILSIALSTIMVWRYIRIREVMVIGKEASYIILTATLSLIVYLITEQFYSIGFLLLQLLVNVICFLYSNLATIHHNRLKWFNLRILSSLIIFLCFGGALAFWVSKQEFIIKAWDAIIYFIFLNLGRVLNFISFIEDETVNEIEINLVRGMGSPPEFITENKLIANAFGGYFGIGMIISVIGLITIILIFKGDRLAQDRLEGKPNKLVTESANYRFDENRGLLKKWRIGKKHRVRVLVHQFERKTAKHQLGRKKSETIDEWLKRIGLEVNIHVYQKVRYGGLNVSYQEVENLRLELERFIDKNM
ncbi:hypothetical protein [Ornithinibacillus californiensis]|uniref:hypothetical protein n=1 Tax=Ornithinibacillus californiensis TaxID=161536 RepID=UPI00064DBF0B|nr:hypothetical protein [Ornithinibacillus californiensis]